MERDAVRLAAYMLASTAVLAGAIRLALGGGRASRWGPIVGCAAAISTVGILFGKYGQNFGLPWQAYYAVPMLATVLTPPLAFRMSLRRSLIYVALALLSAPLIHAAFFYALGWDNYMPFLRLPRP